MAIEILGVCDTRFAALREAFRENFDQRDEIGACVAVVLDGVLVVDLWAGHADVARTRPWRADTLVNVWSLGKAMISLACLHLIDRALIDLEQPVADHWPEFAAAGKDAISFRMALAHRAGLCGIERPLPEDAYFRWELMVDALAAQKPWWEPGTRHGYHTNTFGFLLGEPIRRLTGLTANAYFQQAIARPLGLDFHMGVAAADLERCADLYSSRVAASSPSPKPAQSASASKSDDPWAEMRRCIYRNPDFMSLDPNTREWRMAEFPSTSPQSNARSVAKVFGELAAIHAGTRSGLISRDLLLRACETESDGEDVNLQRPTRFGLGLQLTQPDRPLGPNARTFGHYGNGGHLGFADPDHRLGFAYHMNHQGIAWRDPRNIALTEALYAAL